MNLPHNPTEFLKLVRERIANGETYVCHAINNVAIEATQQINAEGETPGGPTYGYIITMACELHHKVQMAINYVPHSTGTAISTFDMAFDMRHPEGAGDYKQARLTWLTRSIDGSDDRGTVRNIMGSHYPRYYATDEDLARYEQRLNEED